MANLANLSGGLKLAISLGNHFALSNSFEILVPKLLFGNARLRNSVSRLGLDSKQSFETHVPKRSLGTRKTKYQLCTCFASESCLHIDRGHSARENAAQFR